MQTDRQTDRQTDGQTHRQTDMTENITYSHMQMVISRSCNSCKNSEKKLGKNQLQYLSLEAGIDHFDFLSLYCMIKETLQERIQYFLKGVPAAPWGHQYTILPNFLKSA